MEILLLETESIIRRDVIIQLSKLGFNVNTNLMFNNYDCVILGSENDLKLLQSIHPRIFRESIFLFMFTSKKYFDEICPQLNAPVYFIEKPFTNELFVQMLTSINKHYKAFRLKSA